MKGVIKDCLAESKQSGAFLPDTRHGIHLLRQNLYYNIASKAALSNSIFLLSSAESNFQDRRQTWSNRLLNTTQTGQRTFTLIFPNLHGSTLR